MITALKELQRKEKKGTLRKGKGALVSTELEKEGEKKRKVQSRGAER